MIFKFVQIAYLANSLEEKCTQMHDAFDIGPFVYAKNLELNNHVLLGKPEAPFVVDAAFAQSGDVNIEILEMKSTGPNPISMLFENGGEGIHHLACFCDDMNAEKERLASKGYPPLSEFTLGDINLCFADTRKLLGHVLELYENHPDLHSLYETTRNIRNGWDGKTLLIDW